MTSAQPETLRVLAAPNGVRLFGVISAAEWSEHPPTVGDLTYFARNEQRRVRYRRPTARERRQYQGVGAVLIHYRHGMYGLQPIGCDARGSALLAKSKSDAALLKIAEAAQCLEAIDSERLACEAESINESTRSFAP